RATALNRHGSAAQQQAKLIFGGGDLVQNRRDGRGRVSERSFCARCFQCGCSAAFEALGEDSQALGKRVGGAACDSQLLIQLQQSEVIRRDLAQEAQPNATRCFLRGEKSGASSFVEAPDAAPKVHFPERVQRG